MFQNFQSFLGFLFACFTVNAVIKALNLNHLLDPLRDLWKRLDKAGRVLTTLSVAFLAGYAISKERGLRNPGPNLPDWFVALNYNATDTDGDGIPDCWERWTRTNPLVADADQDRDGDCVDNFGEFWNQCDPLMKDTDGDGYSDKLEIEGRAAGKTWFDPIVRAVYEYNDPDCNTNGVPDRWEGLGYVYGYTDANNDGYPDGVSFAPEGNGNFDVEVIVSTTRAALLSWGPSTNEAIVLPPCSCLSVRLRLSGYADTDVRLSCGTAGDGSEGLWYGRLAIRWPEGSGQETEENRIRIESDAVIDCDAMEVSFRGEVRTTPTRTPGDVPTSITSPFRRRWLYLNGLGGGCWEHSPGGWWAEAIYTNMAPPFAWYVNDNSAPSATGDGISGGDIHSYWNGETPVVVRCEWTNGPPHNLIKLEATETVGMHHCPPSVTNIIGAAWTSTHSHTNATDHLPTGHTITNSYQFGPGCPLTEYHVYGIGWDHDKVNTRNLPVISTSDWRDSQTDHCLAIEWVNGGSVNLIEYLNDVPDDVQSEISFTANGDSVSSGVLNYDRPSDLSPCVYHVAVYHASCSKPLDYLWLTVYSTATSKSFSDWESSNTNLAWTLSLPKAYSHVLISAGGKPLKPTVGTTGLWKAPKTINSYLHHNASFDMRSDNPGEHGHQSTFDSSGTLIQSTIAAGTADLYKPLTIRGFVEQHKKHDVLPYLRSLVLDGNPVLPTSEFAPTQLDRPCLYQGDNIDTYIRLRPITPTGIQPGD